MNVMRRPFTRQTAILLALVPSAALAVWMELGLRASLYRQLGRGSIIAGSLPNFVVAASMALFFALLKANRADSGPLKPVLMSIMTLSSYELAQLAIPGRTFDSFDLLATAMGGAVAFVLLQLVYRSHPSVSEGQ